MAAGVCALVGIGVIGTLVDADGDTAAGTVSTSTELAATATSVPAPSDAPSTTSAGTVPATTAAPTATITTVAPTTSSPGVVPASSTTAAPISPQPASATAVGLVVTNVVDGDTVDVSTGQRVRLIGIDTPERGECGSNEATRRVEQLVTGASITMVPGARDDTDRYGRILRYVEVDGVDVGQVLLEEGLAISRYDSRDGYGAHPREQTYQLADLATPQLCAQPEVESVTQDAAVHFQNCSAARAAGAAPILAGQPGYRSALDRDGDGIACE